MRERESALLAIAEEQSQGKHKETQEAEKCSGCNFPRKMNS